VSFCSTKPAITAELEVFSRAYGVHSSSTREIKKPDFIFSLIQQNSLHLEKPIYIKTNTPLSSGEIPV
jgi:hypothetical protein